MPGRCLAHLLRGAAFEDRGELTAANAEYNAALALEPRLAYAEQARELPPPFLAFAWRRFRAMREWYRREFDTAIATTEREQGVRLERLRGAAAMFCGERPLAWAHPLQRPHDLYFPDLPPEPWIDRAALPWAPALEAAAPTIRAEYLAVQGGAGFRPYVLRAFEPGFAALENSTEWSSYFLFERARRNDANCARCPATLAALAAVPLACVDGVPTEAFFSVLAPRGHIPPHCGLSNAKVVVHLPLIVPEGGAMTVAGEGRPWREGQVMAFDVSFLHEARNPADRPRVVFIFEVWNPRLAPAEVVGADRMLAAVQRFKALAPA